MGGDFCVYTKDGRPVEAKYLKDLNGNYIINPETGGYYAVPADFDLKTFIDKYSSLGTAINPMTGQLEPMSCGAIYGSLIAGFWPGGRDDIQRSYNGYRGSTKDDADFVKAFIPAAGLIFGIACKEIGVFDIESLRGGAVPNIVASWFNKNLDISVIFGNAEDNEFQIRYGYSQQFFTSSPTAAISHTTTTPSRRQLTEVLTADIARAEDDEAYIVKPGNILGDIARKFGTMEEELMRLNPDIRNPYEIYVGQKIILPNADNANAVNPNLSSFQFNADGNITSYTDSDGKVTTYNYDASGNLTKATGPDGRITTYQRQYNEQNLCTRLTVTEPTGEVTVYQYDAGGMVTTMTDPIRYGRELLSRRTG